MAGEVKGRVCSATCGGVEWVECSVGEQMAPLYLRLPQKLRPQFLACYWKEMALVVNDAWVPEWWEEMKCVGAAWETEAQ